MSYLLSKHKRKSTGCIQKITKESAGWSYVEFEVYRLEPKQILRFDSKSQELCVVLISGNVNFFCEDESWNDVGERVSPFDKIPPISLFVGQEQEGSIEALTKVEVAICRAPATTKRKARLISSEELKYTTRGTGTNKRSICNILFGDDDADSLLIVEVLTPGGSWSSYPPHKHDTNNGEFESALEEVYYHRLNPEQGFVFQRVYTDSRDIDETMCVHNRDAVIVPKGYHPVGVPHGYESYYLNVMAGPERRWVFNNDPDHEWILKE
ncbi:5-deoxyglucuronate isomerase [Alteromonas macleodii]|uniref:5-deoxy-glucuronate isomerase n=1 Tax=Alteromonas macleodii TaxID=28108 RepID=UPI00057FE671|nr:5-deoxy-glucuronate isomerase [Alteromonas macleodii]KHT51470.1 5-deoxyglucuronate isomerase [Alteromonas macleodii]